ncbi:MAG: PD40 domain-containing protein [Bacteroidetes bacterium]|nr:PD40 domain-containing protein [Bacteroidota bacterium]
MMKHILIAAAACILILAGCKDQLPTNYTPTLQSNPRIYYSLGETAAQIGGYRVDPAGTNRTRLVGGALFSPPAHGLIAYAGSDHIGMVANLDGSNPHKVIDAAQNLQPVLSPDGTQIAYMPLGDSIIVVDVDGTHPRTVAHNVTTGCIPAFSPDGSRLAYISSKIWPMKLHVVSGIRAGQTLQDREVADNAANSAVFKGELKTAWSPDGTKLAYSGAGTGTDSTDIFVVNADGTGRVDMTNGPGFDIMPAWSPDGKSMAFVRVGGDFFGHVSADIWITKDGGLTMQNVTNTPGFDVIEICPEWSPDGKSIAYGVLEPYAPFQQANNRHSLSTVDLATQTVHTLEASGVDGFVFWTP